MPKISCHFMSFHVPGGTAVARKKRDALESNNYRGIKLLEIALKVYERVT